MLIKRELFLDVGGFDQDFFAIFEDVDLGWRLWLLGYQVKSCPGSIVYHRGHGTFQEHSSARMRYLMHRNALLTVIKFLDMGSGGLGGVVSRGIGLWLTTAATVVGIVAMGIGLTTVTLIILAGLGIL